MSLEQFAIIDSTLREGEQFINANFTHAEKIRIARALDEFGVECLELTSPLASPGSAEDVRTIARLGLQARILTHIRCQREDASIALDTGAAGIDVVIGTSSPLRQFSHSKSIEEIIDLAADVLTWIRSQAPDVILRFSTEDSFRSEEAELLRVYLAVDRLGVVNRLGIADTVGIAAPSQVGRLVSTLRRLTKADIEFHGHNDSGCAIANAFAALEAGATHIDTTVLGIGERNGIAALGGFVARMYTWNRNVVRQKYRLERLRALEQLVAELVGVDIPFNNCVTGYSAFTHKAGIHAKAILNAPETYEALDPHDFGVARYISIAHRLTGWNAVKSRADQLNLELTTDQIKALTRHIKILADEKLLTLDDVDDLLRMWANGYHPDSDALSAAASDGVEPPAQAG
jgi:homocitrate synthase